MMGQKMWFGIICIICSTNRKYICNYCDIFRYFLQNLRNVKLQSAITPVLLKTAVKFAYGRSNGMTTNFCHVTRSEDAYQVVIKQHFKGNPGQSPFPATSAPRRQTVSLGEFPFSAHPQLS